MFKNFHDYILITEYCYIIDCWVRHKLVMSDRISTMKLEAEMAAPLHLQRLERSLNVQPFLRQMNDLFQEARYNNLSIIC